MGEPMRYEAPGIETRESIEEPYVLGKYVSPTWTTEEPADS